MNWLKQKSTKKDFLKKIAVVGFVGALLPKKVFGGRLFEIWTEPDTQLKTPNDVVSTITLGSFSASQEKTFTIALSKDKRMYNVFKIIFRVNCSSNQNVCMVVLDGNGVGRTDDGTTAYQVSSYSEGFMKTTDSYLTDALWSNASSGTTGIRLKDAYFTDKTRDEVTLVFRNTSLGASTGVSVNYRCLVW